MQQSENEIVLELRKFVAPEFIYGVGARFSAGKYCRQLGAHKVFLVTDNVVSQTQWFQDVFNSLADFDLELEVFDNVSPNPRDFEVMEGAEKFLKPKCNVILALGGGSVIDCAKGIGIVATNKKISPFSKGLTK